MRDFSKEIAEDDAAFEHLEVITADDVKGAFDNNGGGAVVNSSRGIICAYKKRGGSFDGAARDAALEMREALRKAAGL